MSLFKPYSLSSEQVTQMIEQVLAGTMGCRDWDNFISIPIKGNLEMEKIRAKCEALSDQEHIESSGNISHSKLAQLELLEILKELQSAT